VFPLHSPIALEEFDEQKYRTFVRTISDEALIKEGKQVRWLSGDGKIVSMMPSAFDEQLKTRKEQYRRRQPSGRGEGAGIDSDSLISTTSI